MRLAGAAVVATVATLGFVAGWAAAAGGPPHPRDLALLVWRQPGSGTRLRALRARARAGAASCACVAELLYGLSSQAVALAEAGLGWAEEMETAFCGADAPERKKRC